MQELQEEKNKLSQLEEASSGNLSIDKTGNLITVDLGISASGSAVNDAMTAAFIAAEEQAAAASGRRLRRRDEKAVGEVVNGLPSIGNISTAVASSAAAASTTAASASRRKQVNNIYTYSRKQK